MPHLISFIFIATLTSYSYANIERGKELYHQVCMACHGHDLNGGIGPSLLDNYWKHGDTPEGIFKTISEGIYDSNMVSFKNVFSEADRNSLVNFLLSKHTGIRSVVRHAYPNNILDGKKLNLDAFENIKPLKSFTHPENVIYFDHNPSLITKVEAKLYLSKDDDFFFDFNYSHFSGETRIYIDGQERYFFKAKKEAKLNNKSNSFPLKKGVHTFTFLHKKDIGWHRLSGKLSSKSGQHYKIYGESMKGAAPKLISADSRAKIIRKKLNNNSPRSVLLVLPNQVILSVNTNNGSIEHAWNEAKIDLTKSIADRGGANSIIMGKSTSRLLSGIKVAGIPAKIKYLASQIQGPHAILELTINGAPYSFTYSSLDKNKYSITATSASPIKGLELIFSESTKLNGNTVKGTIPLTTENASTFKIEPGVQ